MSIYVCMYIWMYMCGSLCVLVDGRPRRASYLRHLCLYWYEDHTKSFARENTQNWKRRTKDVNPKRRGRHFRSQEWNSKVGSLEWDFEAGRWKVRTMTRWVSIFGCCVRFSLSYRDSHMNIHRMLKSAYFTFLRLQFWIRFCVSFLPPTVCCLLFFKDFLENLWNAHTVGCEN